MYVVIYNIHVCMYMYMYVCCCMYMYACTCMCVVIFMLYMLMRNAEGRKKEASKVKQTTKQSNTAHPRQSPFQRKMSCLGWDHMYMYMCIHHSRHALHVYSPRPCPPDELHYHINLVDLLSMCTEGKNVTTEMNCHSLLPLDEIVRVVAHQDCIPEV